MGGASKFVKPGHTKCPVQYCTTCTDSKKGFYQIPENPKRREEWLDACRLPKSTKTYTSICWKHFKSSDYQNELGYGRLKKNVVPSKFPLVIKKPRTFLDLGSEVVVDNTPASMSVPLSYPPEEMIVHNASSNEHDYASPKVSTTCPKAIMVHFLYLSNFEGSGIFS